MTDEKNMRSDHGFYLATITLLVRITVYPPPNFLEATYTDLVMLVPDTAGPFGISPLLDTLEVRRTH